LTYNIFIIVCRIIQLHKPAFCHAFIKRILIDRLQQDGAPSHTARNTEACSVRTSSLSQTFYPPNSPDLNTVNLPSCALCYHPPVRPSIRPTGGSVATL